MVPFATREEALGCARGDILLGFCRDCGFIFNLAFRSETQLYPANYEASQSHSAVFNAFHRHLAQSLIERWDLHNKTIIEIGCGNGDFLELLCALGPNRGVGFDPAYKRRPESGPNSDDIIFIKDKYSEKYADHRADFFCCKMTLEHIAPTADFVRMLRKVMGQGPQGAVFFQVPDVARILNEVAFWDIYYEHCSYFCPESLIGLFRHCGFEVRNVWKAYNDQYLMIDAQPAGSADGPDSKPDDKIEALSRAVTAFTASGPSRVAHWKQRLAEHHHNGTKTVIWGASSKTVAFLSTLDIEDEIEFVIDINPLRQNTYIGVSGQKIVAPPFLKHYRPDLVIAMNPVYRREIKQDLERMGLSPALEVIA